FNRTAFAVRQFRPAILEVSLDHRLVLSQSPFETDIAVGMAIVEVMQDLPHRPTVRTIALFQGCFGQTLNPLPYPAGENRDFLNGGIHLGSIEMFHNGMLPDGETKVR